MLLSPALGLGQQQPVVDAPFGVALQAVPIEGLGGLQSFAFGQHQGKWLVVGGRLDGLHRRQPWATFDLAGHNNRLIVVDPAARSTWSAPLDELPAALREQLSSTNMNFHQEGDYLYCLGGYGYSAIQGDHTTFANLAALDVPRVIEAIVAGEPFAQHIRQIEDPQFQVTGGRLLTIGQTYHLLGGQRFIGRYNPMGPDHGPGFIQEYTDAVRRFRLTDDGQEIAVEHLEAFTDADNLHRRDYNAEAQILPDGSQAITMFSGVFQPTADLPFLTAVTVDGDGHAVEPDFEQHYNHYHCPVVPLHSESAGQMHTIFFGGIAQFVVDSAGTMLRDDDVPFVRTIACVTRDAEGGLREWVLPAQMPALLGAGGEFIPDEGLPRHDNGVLRLDELEGDSVRLGHIFGGISSTDANIFWLNDGTQSSASAQVFELVLVRGSAPTGGGGLRQAEAGHALEALPNPSHGELELRYRLEAASRVALTLADSAGKVLGRASWLRQSAGQHSFRPDWDALGRAGVYFVRLESAQGVSTLRLVVAP